jgi:hypothetical protein
MPLTRAERTTGISAVALLRLTAVSYGAASGWRFPGDLEQGAVLLHPGRAAAAARRGAADPA